MRMLLSKSYEVQREDTMAKSRHLPLITDDLRQREGISPLHMEERLPADYASRALAALPHDCGEDAQPVTGERLHGAGTNGCDQETRAWNPRFESMNYALARVSSQ